MKHEHGHTHTLPHPTAVGVNVVVRHSHEHNHTVARYGQATEGLPYHSPHSHTSAQNADLRRQQNRQAPGG